MNKLLARQLKKFDFNEEQAPQDVKDWQLFLKAVESTYSQHDKDRYLIERSFEISSQEITDQIQQNKEMSAHLAQSSKLAAIGTLASGVAHELNNPLAAVRGYIELLLQSCGSDHPDARDTLNRIIGLTERMAKITGQLLNLSHKADKNEIGFCNLQDSINDIVDLSTKQFELNKIQIKTNFCSKELIVCGDLTRMAGVFQNLLTNSRDAFASNPDRSRKSLVEISVMDSAQFGYLDIVFKDNAGGIPSHILPNIFDPFFTTKGVGGGTGLGLSLIRNSLLEIDSSIAVAVEEPFTIFKIKLKKSNQTIKSDKIIRPVASVKMDTTASKLRTLFVSDDSLSKFADDFKNYLEVTVVSGKSDILANVSTTENFKFLILDEMQSYEAIADSVKGFLQSNPEIKLVVLTTNQSENLVADTFKDTEHLLINMPISSRAEFLFKLNDVTPTFSMAA